MDEELTISSIERPLVSGNQKPKAAERTFTPANICGREEDEKGQQSDTSTPVNVESFVVNVRRRAFRWGDRGRGKG